MAREPVRVSDHAVIRYLERAMGFNIEAVRQHIAGICEGPAGIGAICVRSEGVRFEITSNTVLTVRPDIGGRPSKTTRDRNQHFIERKERERNESRSSQPDLRPRHIPLPGKVADPDLRGHVVATVAGSGVIIDTGGRSILDAINAGALPPFSVDPATGPTGFGPDFPARPK